jgi:hypothetical protein
MRVRALHVGGSFGRCCAIAACWALVVPALTSAEARSNRAHRLTPDWSLRRPQDGERYGVPVRMAIGHACEGEQSGNTILVAWALPMSGAAPAGYIVHVSGSVVAAFPTTALSLSGMAAPGTYAVSVAATNSCGESVPTAAQTVTIP